MNLSNSIQGCSEVDDKLQCSWSLPTHASKIISLTLKFNLGLQGKFFEENVVLNATSAIFIQNYQNVTILVNTTLILDPTPPIWPWIAGILPGLLVLAALIFGLYKYGFFTRKQYEDLKRLQEQSEASNSLADLTLEDDDNRTQDILLSEDSD